MIHQDLLDEYAIMLLSASRGFPGKSQKAFRDY
jgi:hypothetical protein